MDSQRPDSISNVAYDASRAACQSLPNMNYDNVLGQYHHKRGSTFRMKLGLVVKVHFIVRTECPGVSWVLVLAFLF